MQQYFIDTTLTLQQVETITDPRIVHHVVKVMRMRPEAQFELVDATHQPYLAVLQAVAADQKQLQVQITKRLQRQTELPVSVTLACGLPKREKTEWIVQKATEMGASKIVFFGGERSVVRWDTNKAAKKLARLQLIAQEAGEQSHRNVWPTVTFVSNITAVTALSASVKLFAYEESGKQGENRVLKTALNQLNAEDELLCVFGPEGGISENETAILRTHDFQATGLGPRILRTETAPLYFLSCVSYAAELIYS
ncbi:16S rRNA (uracil(1498)-N(3))-methyltransferase [Agrilactobacillus yilanensis]|uniref:Ribosomal RNA small subunit methyltransferase E n=1 Tax=Agrilactobacillus yilanensis TaxID=2485997 RepID=A0ABW4JBA4_9LACO|nr:16S rRNA (uracil(1498)-N(3))-methyltransferase [Agrilactobacillus yilanensis]